MGAPIAFGLLQLFLCLVALLVGAEGASRSEHRRGLILAGAVTLGFALLALVLPEYGQQTRVLRGVVVASLGLGAAPQLVCHLLGFSIGKRYPPGQRGGAIIGTFVATGLVVVPVSFLLFLVAFRLVACDAGQYDCPFG